MASRLQDDFKRRREQLLNAEPRYAKLNTSAGAIRPISELIGPESLESFPKRDNPSDSYQGATLKTPRGGADFGDGLEEMIKKRLSDNSS